jgi:hypothetical protein
MYCLELNSQVLINSETCGISAFPPYQLAYPFLQEPVYSLICSLLRILLQHKTLYSNLCTDDLALDLGICF